MPSALPDLAPLLRTIRFGRAVRWHAVTDSTNAEALRWAAAGAPEGALVGADHQRAGRGRHGRQWTDAPGQGLLVSLVLRPTLVPDQLGLIPLAAGVAVAEVLEQTLSLAPRLKWPNDVLLGERKVGGLLLEGHLTPPPGQDKTHATGATFVLGLGLNVNQTDFPAEIADQATSLALEVGRPLPRLPLLADLLAALETYYDRLLDGGGEAVCAAFEARMLGRGCEAAIAFAPDAPAALHGQLLGVHASGALRLGMPDGERLLHAGEVTLDVGREK
ncbi:MAG: biotin--[acetyl-CoA-carboxylase] ligase [Rhodothermaceae bacterium]|nr:biotin--[acetyl-CoA-carboxylase] ligase [Rhodothermaceae bacterium]